MKNVQNEKNYLFSKKIDDILLSVYNAYHFVARFFRELIKGPFEWKEFVLQCYRIGYLSLPLITLTGFITGVVFTKQSRPSLSEFGATSWLPSLVSIAIIRALAPLVTALISAGRIGSSIGAELGSMKVTEQIDAMEVSAINPFKYLVVTRTLATTLMIPILTFYCGFVSMMGAFLNVYQNENTSFPLFIEKAFESISFLDINTTLVKAVFYGFTIGIVGSYKGFNTSQGTEGVGRAANSAVVTSMFYIFIEEILIVQIANWIRFM